MNLDEEQTLLAAAAVEVLEQIDSHQQSAALPLRPVFKHLGIHLFNPDFDLESWLGLSELGAEATRRLFRRQTGIEADTYLWDCRLQTALWLLRETSLSVTVVGELVCFSGRQAFSDAFESWLGERPTAYRVDAKERSVRFGSPPSWMLSESFVRRLEAGLLTDKEIGEVDGRLRDIRNKRLSLVNDESRSSGREERLLEEVMAAKLWNKIEDLPLEEQKLFVANQVVFETTALADLFKAKSDQVGGVARQELECLAELAEEALERTRDRTLSVSSTSD